MKYHTKDDILQWERLNKDLDIEKDMRLRSQGFSTQRNIARNPKPVIIEEVIQPQAPISYGEKIARLRGQGFSQGRNKQSVKMPLPAYSTLPAIDNSVFNMPKSADTLGGYKIHYNSMTPNLATLGALGLGGVAMYKHLKQNSMPRDIEQGREYHSLINANYDIEEGMPL